MATFCCETVEVKPASKPDLHWQFVADFSTPGRCDWVSDMKNDQEMYTLDKRFYTFMCEFTRSHLSNYLKPSNISPGRISRHSYFLISIILNNFGILGLRRILDSEVLKLPDPGYLRHRMFTWNLRFFVWFMQEIFIFGICCQEEKHFCGLILGEKVLSSKGRRVATLLYICLL
jgi:hypothetical protein